LNKSLALLPISERLLVDHRQTWHRRCERFGKQSAARRRRCIRIAVHEYRGRSAAWRSGFEDKPADTSRGKIRHAGNSPSIHPVRPVFSALNACEPYAFAAGANAISAAHELNRLARDTHADFHLRTDRDPFDQRREFGDRWT